MEKENIVYGINPVKELLENSVRTVEKVILESSSGSLFPLLKICKKNKIQYQILSRQKINFLSATSKNQGILAYCSAKPYSTLKDILDLAKEKKEIPFIVVADSVEDPRNLGALIRTCSGAGVHGIILPKQGGVGLTPVTAKTSAGTLENMLIARSVNIAKDLEYLSSSGFVVLGLEANTSLPYYKVKMDIPLVVVVGGEDKGIRPHIKRNCTEICSIPINPSCQSLNLSVAAAVVLFEASKQRGNIT